MRTVAERYGYKPSRAGYICCPFHLEKTPSLKVYDKIGRGFHCYGCGKGGSVIDFVMEEFHLDFRAATIRLASDFGIVDPCVHMSREDAVRAREAAYKRQKAEREREALHKEYVAITDAIHTSRPMSAAWADAMKRLPQVEAELEWLEESRYGR